MYCTNCGKQIDDSSVFCTNCGAKVELNNTDTNNYTGEYNTNNQYDSFNNMNGTNMGYTNISLGDRAGLKLAAKKALRNSNNHNPYLITLVYMIILYAINFLPIWFVTYLLCSIMGVGYGFWILSVARNQSSTKEFEYAINNIVPVAILGILLGIILSVGYALLIIPGVILSLGFSMSVFVLRDTDCRNAVDALEYSWKITKGYKMDLFTLMLSFIPWIFLTIITGGIVGIYVLPYMQTTFALYYDRLRQLNS